MEQASKLADVSRQFIDRINKKESLVAIVGLGYVGLPLIMGFNKIGFSTLGIDIDEDKINSLADRKSYIAHFSDDGIAEMVDTGRFVASTDFSRLKEADAILLCVPTPLSKHHEPDLSYVTDTTKAIAPYVRKGQLIILESTTYPGTTREVLQPILEEGSGLVADEDFIVAYSPEREDLGNPDFDTATIAKVVGATTSQGLDMATALYETLIGKVVKVSTPETAEAVKLTENIFRAVNIALVNELKMIYDDMGIDVWEVIDAAATKPFGFMPFYPGPGLGGHCIPIDPFYLTWKAREYDHQTRFIELAGEINASMPDFVVHKVMLALNERGKALKGARVLVLGIAYKKNIDDMRESPAVVIMEKLRDLGARISYSDPHVLVFPKMRRHHFDLKSKKLTPQVLRESDCVLLATDHDAFDYDMIAQHAPLIVDTRGRFSATVENVIKA
ncbi:MAG: nucleotide sugar dehydrogenase [Hyphomicrobiaceae bacterium]|nr:nucleotide sugar dehydrogenase [Hyphomicrobiaceae bacterium]